MVCDWEAGGSSHRRTTWSDGIMTSLRDTGAGQVRSVVEAVAPDLLLTIAGSVQRRNLRRAEGQQTRKRRGLAYSARTCLEHGQQVVHLSFIRIHASVLPAHLSYNLSILRGPHLTSPHLTSPHLTTPHHTTPHHASSPAPLLPSFTSRVVPTVGVALSSPAIASATRERSAWALTPI